MFAQSNRTALLLRREAAWGETPVYNAGTPWQQMRFTSESLDLDKQTVVSEVIRADRMTDDLLYVGRSVSGDIAGEMAFSEFDDLMCGALGNTAWVTGGSAGTPVTASLAWTGPAGTITLSAGTWAAHGVVPYIMLAVKGFTNAVNNGEILVTQIVGAVLTFIPMKGITPVTEAGASVSYHYEYLKNSVDQPSYAAEKQFQDVSVFAEYIGLYVNTMSIDMTALEIVKISFGLMGKDNLLTDSPGLTGTGGQVVATHATPPITASVNIGALLVDGIPVTSALKSMKFDTSNNLRKQEVIGSPTPGGFGQGSFEIKGSTDAYLEDKTLWAKVLSHANLGQIVSTTDANGKRYCIGLPKANYSKGAGKTGGKNQDVMLPLEFEATRDSVTNAMLLVSRSAPDNTWT